MGEIKQFILNEKYRPDNLENYLCNEELKSKFQSYIDNQQIPHLLLAGRAGSGKTTLAKIFVNNIDCDYLYINATDERSMDVMRDKVGAFASASSFKPLKIVILDECLEENTLVTVFRKGQIQQIPICKVNDKEDLVKSFNEITKEIQWRPFKLFDKGIQDCYELEFENGEKIICTESHKWYMKDNNDNIQVVTTREVIEKGYILTV